MSHFSGFGSIYYSSNITLVSLVLKHVFQNVHFYFVILFSWCTCKLIIIIYAFPSAHFYITMIRCAFLRYKCKN